MILTEKSIFIFFIAICLLTIVTYYVYINKTHTVVIEDLDEIRLLELEQMIADYPNHHCIEKNICNMDVTKSNIYVYKDKTENFYHKIFEPINSTKPIHHAEEVVPRIVHFVWFGEPRKKFLFFNMLSVLAAFRFARAERVYFWCDNLPAGEYWDELGRRIKNLYRIKITRPDNVWGKPVKNLQHCSDIVRLEAILQYGGMYFDFDAFVVNFVDPLLHYDCTLGAEEPTTLANGIMFSKPWSDFFKLWYINYKTFTDKEWATHSTIAAYNISKFYPSLIHVEQNSLMKPNYFTMRENIFGPEIWDFKRKNYCLHAYWRFSDHKGLHPNDIRKYNTTLGGIFRYIYYNEPAIPGVQIPS